MSYFIYRNWVAEKKAVIHKGVCGMCKNGRGCHTNPLGNKNGEWSKEFKTFSDAKKEASVTYQGRRLKVRFCAKCKPDIDG